MPLDFGQPIPIAEAGLAAIDAELARALERQRHAVYTKTATGVGNVANTFQLDTKFRLVFVRCHFVGGTGQATMTISLDSAHGPGFDAQLAQVKLRGTGADVFFIPSDTGLSEPSSWTFQVGDAVRIDWPNPNPFVMTWGLEVGMAIAS
ncbi:MAG: hypothetical protein ACE5E6_11250 [Phycisphaerae bacterium]